MLLHLPIVILTTLSPVAISDTPPRFDIARECRFESESSKAFDRCARDEGDALKQLETEWPQFVGADRTTCEVEATVAGFASYVELLTCLEMARDIGNDKTNPGRPSAAPSAHFAPPELSAVDKAE
ncbi:MAG: hypothetical protein WDN50_10435 [Bradyrhizobium sp.]